MVERVLCKHEVIGSIPFTSTRFEWVRSERSGRRELKPGAHTSLLSGRDRGPASEVERAKPADAGARRLRA